MFCQSRQTRVCRRDKSKPVLSRQNYVCRNKIFLSHVVVVTKLWSQQAYLCRDKRCILSQQTRVCRDKSDTCGNCPANDTPLLNQTHGCPGQQLKNDLLLQGHWGREDACGWLSVALGLPVSTEPVGLLGTGAQDGHLDFHTAHSRALRVRAKRAGFDAS